MKKKKDIEQYKLKDLIKTLKLTPEDEVFIHIYKKNDEDSSAVIVSNIPANLLNRTVKVVMPNCGGQEYGYKLYKFILE